MGCDAHPSPARSSDYAMVALRSSSQPPASPRVHCRQLLGLFSRGVTDGYVFSPSPPATERPHLLRPPGPRCPQQPPAFCFSQPLLSTLTACLPTSSFILILFSGPPCCRLAFSTLQFFHTTTRIQLSPSSCWPGLSLPETPKRHSPCHEKVRG